MDSMPMSMPGMSMPGPVSTASSASSGNLTSTSVSAAQATMGSEQQPQLNTMPMGGCKISMLWNWYTVDACFLSESWQIKSAGGFAGLCIGVILLVILLEFLRRVAKFYDNHIYRAYQFRAVALDAQQGNNSSAAEEGHAGSRAPADSSPENPFPRVSSASSTSLASTATVYPSMADPSAAGPSSTAPSSATASGGAPTTSACSRARQAASGGPEQPLLPQPANPRPCGLAYKPSISQQAIRALIQTLQFAVGYWIMLLAMYYNGYILISIFIGAFIAAFALRWEYIGASELERPGETIGQTTGCHG